MECAGAPPAPEKNPTTTRSPPGMTVAPTTPLSYPDAAPLVPVPTADHPAPSQRATLRASTAPAVPNVPTATRSSPRRTASPDTCGLLPPLTPPPSADH